jgi:hypothetical protein
MFKTSSGISLAEAAYNNKLVTFTLSTANNYYEELNLVSPFYNCKFVKILASQPVELEIGGFQLSNYKYVPNSGPNPFTKSNLIFPQISDNIFYKIDNDSSISKVSLKVVDTSQLLANSISVTIYFLDYTPSLIAE